VFSVRYRLRLSLFLFEPTLFPTVTILYLGQKTKLHARTSHTFPLCPGLLLHSLLRSLSCFFAFEVLFFSEISCAFFATLHLVECAVHLSSNSTSFLAMFTDVSTLIRNRGSFTRRRKRFDDSVAGKGGRQDKRENRRRCTPLCW
jgi:hypothetical protein